MYKNRLPIRCLFLLCSFICVVQLLIAQDCNCEKYIYLNEVNEDATLKFSINADGSLTEVLNPNTGGHWQDNVTFAPHGAYMGPNGYVYVGNFDGVGGVDRYNCDGTLDQADFIPIASGNGTDGTSGYASNIYVVDNILYMNTWVGSGYSEGGVFAYDLCSGEILGLHDGR